MIDTIVLAAVLIPDVLAQTSESDRTRAVQARALKARQDRERRIAERKRQPKRGGFYAWSWVGMEVWSSRP